MQLNTQGKKTVDDFGGLPLPGRYHAGVKAVKEDTQENPETVIVEFELYAGTVPGQEKKVISAYLGKKESWMVDRLTRFAMAVGLIGGNEQREVIFADAIGRQLIVEVEDRENKKDGKTYRQLSREGFWPIGHERLKDVPVDQVMLKLHLPGVAAAPAATPAAPIVKPDFTQAATTPAPAPAKKWGDL